MSEHAQHGSHTGRKGMHHYRRLLVMMILSFMAMYILMYAMVDRLANVYPSFNQLYMAGLMTAAMLGIELAGELGTVSEKARAGKLSLDEMQGGGFTITNLGGIGGTSFTPIVNWPEVAILGISRGAHEPVYSGQAFEPRLMLPLSLSYDHRVIDGADAARFLRWIAEAFEQPFVLAL